MLILIQPFATGTALFSLSTGQFGNEQIDLLSRNIMLKFRKSLLILGLTALTEIGRSSLLTYIIKKKLRLLTIMKYICS